MDKVKSRLVKGIGYATLILGFMGGVFLNRVEAEVSFSTTVPHALLVDLTTGDVLFEKEARIPMPPSSMTKIMTIYMVFEALTQGRLREDDTLSISRLAATQGGSRMFLVAGSKVRVADLIQGMIVSSGNDACVVVAEGLAGSQEAFVTLMNKKALHLGALQSHFVNATGWPEPEHVSTCWDLMIMAAATLRDFPELYAKYYGQKSFSYNRILQYNRNALLFKNRGADGLKTGSTEVGGYGVVVSALKEGRRLILVINGARDETERLEEAQKIMTYGFRAFDCVAPHAKGDKALEIAVNRGVDDKAVVVFGDDVRVSVPRGQAVQLKMRLHTPLEAPLARGQDVGVCEIYREGEKSFLKTIPLLCGQEVARRPGWWIRTWQWLKSWMIRPDMPSPSAREPVIHGASEKLSELIHNPLQKAGVA